MEPEELSREVFKQFCKMGFSEEKYFVKGFTRVNDDINPIMKLGFEKDLAETVSHVNQYENLYNVGGSVLVSHMVICK